MATVSEDLRGGRVRVGGREAHNIKKKQVVKTFKTRTWKKRNNVLVTRTETAQPQNSSHFCATLESETEAGVFAYYLPLSCTYNQICFSLSVLRNDLRSSTEASDLKYRQFTGIIQWSILYIWTLIILNCCAFKFHTHIKKINLQRSFSRKSTRESELQCII